MDDLIMLVGCGGHGRMVLDAALASGVRVTGILDSALQIGERVFDVPVRGGDEVLESPDVAGAKWLNGIGANPSLILRQALYLEFQHRFELMGIQHPAALTGRAVTLGAGVQLMAGSIIMPGTSVGINAVVNTRASIDHDCTIGDHCFIAPGAVLCGGVHLGPGVFVGAGAIILPGVSVGAGAVIGAAAMVSRDVPESTVMIGNPARQLG